MSYTINQTKYSIASVALQLQVIIKNHDLIQDYDLAIPSLPFGLSQEIANAFYFAVFARVGAKSYLEELAEVVDEEIFRLSKEIENPNYEPSEVEIDDGVYSASYPSIDSSLEDKLLDLGYLDQALTDYLDLLNK